MIKYPDDFKKFKGKELTDEEINNLLQEKIEGEGTSIRLGDTMIVEGEFGYIGVWELVADYFPDYEVADYYPDYKVKENIRQAIIKYTQDIHLDPSFEELVNLIIEALRRNNA